MPPPFLPPTNATVIHPRIHESRRMSPQRLQGARLRASPRRLLCRWVSFWVSSVSFPLLHAFPPMRLPSFYPCLLFHIPFLSPGFRSLFPFPVVSPHFRVSLPLFLPCLLHSPSPFATTHHRSQLRGTALHLRSPRLTFPPFPSPGSPSPRPQSPWEASLVYPARAHTVKPRPDAALSRPRGPPPLPIPNLGTTAGAKYTAVQGDMPPPQISHLP